MEKELKESKGQGYSPSEIVCVAGRPVLNFFVAVPFIALVAICVDATSGPNPFFPVLFIGLFWYLLLIFTVHSFAISRNTLEVRRYYWPGWRKEYPISTVKKVLVLSAAKGIHRLHVISTDDTVTRYPSAALRDKDWVQLIKLLKNAGVPVELEFPGMFRGYDF